MGNESKSLLELKEKNSVISTILRPQLLAKASFSPSLETNIWRVDMFENKKKAVRKFTSILV